MPHALSMPSPGFQAIILCGPGSSFPTFTSNPEEFPKALIPIANRPMVWYPIDFCYRTGITNITLIAPPSSAAVITAALNTNPHLTTLPLPKPNLLAPRELDQTTGTAQIFRLAEVRDVIKGDFVVLPCDLVCEIGGETLLETWMVKEAGFGGATGGGHEFTGPKMALGGEKGGRRGGLGVWYQTKGDHAVKGEETDFIATSPLEQSPVPLPKESLLSRTSKLVYSVPTDTLNDIIDEKSGLPIRHRMIDAHPRLRMLGSHRDAHLYIFPAWVLDMINSNEHMDNISEDVIGWWAKAGWQDGLGDKLGLRKILKSSSTNDVKDDDGSVVDDEIDIGVLSSTWTSDLTNTPSPAVSRSEIQEQPKATMEGSQSSSKLVIPPILSYIHPSTAGLPLIRRIDTAPLLLAVSLHLAKLESIEAVGRAASSPLAHNSKVGSPTDIATKSTVTRSDCLLAENVTVEEKCAIKECVIGANCQIRQGAKLTRCVLMDGVIVGKGCKLTGCIIGRRSEIGEDSILQDCETQNNMLVEAKNYVSVFCHYDSYNLADGSDLPAEAKNEKFMSSQGLEASEQEFQDAFADEEELPNASADGADLLED